MSIDGEYTTIGLRRLRAVRTKIFKLNIQQMSQLLNVNRGTYEKWEHGNREPGAATVELIRILIWLKNTNQLDQWLKYKAQDKKVTP